MPNRELELVPGGSSLIRESALIMQMCSNVRKNEANGREREQVRHQRGKMAQLIQEQTKRRNIVIKSLMNRKPTGTLKERGDMIKMWRSGRQVEQHGSKLSGVFSVGYFGEAASRTLQ